MLAVTDHSRDSAGLNYVYPVISRRSGGLSIGINLNPNNACNWRCVYCQVPNLVRGAAPFIELTLLQHEIECFIDDVLAGDFYDRHGVEHSLRMIKDIAISGNGEPTSAKNFDRIVALIGQSIRHFDLHNKIKFVLITNGSLVHRKGVQVALKNMHANNGEVWFKIDSGTDAGLKNINNSRLSIKRVKENLALASGVCPTWIQTCVFNQDQMPPSIDECSAYLQFLASLKDEDIHVQGVLLYGLARPSMQPEAGRLSAVSLQWISQFADDIRHIGLPVKCFP